MSKIIDKIKGFGHSLTTMFQENDQEDVDYLNPKDPEAKKLAEAMKPYIDEMDRIEADRERFQRSEVDRLRNSKEGELSKPTYYVQEGQAKSSKGRKRTTDKEQNKDLGQADGREGR